MGGRAAVWTQRVAVLGLVVAIVPVVVAAARSLVDDRVPVGDNALIAIRAADVGTEHNPLLGLWSSASLNVDGDVHHPGPLLFALLTVPVRLLGPSGTALGVAAINVAAIVGIALVGRRRGGPRLMAVATLVAAALSWSMGSQLLVEPWQPHVVLLPFFLFLLLVWSTTCGDRASLPCAAAIGSYVLQAHLSYALLVPALGAWATIWLLLPALRGASSDDRRRTVRALVLTGIVLVACWSLPLWEQLTGSGSGNLTKLLASAGGDGTTLGVRLALRMVVSVLTVPTWWLQPSFTDAWLGPSGSFRPGQSDLPSTPAAVIGFVAVGAVLAGAAWLAGRGHDRDGGRAVGMAGFALVVGVVTATIVPAGPFGIAPHQFRWLWPLAAFTTFAVVAVVVRAVATSDVRRRWLVGAAVVGTAVVAALTLPTGDESPASPAEGIATATGLAARLGVLEEEGPVLVQPPPVFNDPYVPAVMAELRHRGVPFVVEPPLTLQVGEGRRADEGEARAALSLGFGDDPVPPEGGRAVARYRSVTVFLTPLG